MASGYVLTHDANLGSCVTIQEVDVGMEKEQKQEFIGMEGICITHSCIPLYTVYVHATHNSITHSGGNLSTSLTPFPPSNFLKVFSGSFPFPF